MGQVLLDAAATDDVSGSGKTMEQRRVVHAAALGIALSALGACAGIRHGASINDCMGQVLRATEGAGAERLKVEMEYDSAIDNMVAQYGTPDYILVESRLRVRAAYVVDDRVFLFERAKLARRSSVTVVEPIPDDLARLFTRTDQDKLAEVRRFRNRQKATPTPASRRGARSKKKR
jgi:hypothetical protein